MAKRLQDNLSTDYIGAAGRLNSRRKRRRIVAYVEGYDDIFFWRSLLEEVETDDYYFEVMLPSRRTLQKGKKVALMNAISRGLGPNMIVCCDADYDYLLQGTTGVSDMVCHNPYVFHTYTYSIENYQCYAPSLRTVCVMATLNDHRIFDFEAFVTAYSQIIHPLFVWSIWCYKYDSFKVFSMQDFANIVEMNNVSLHNPNADLDKLRRRVNAKISWLQRHLPSARKHLKDVESSMTQLGVTPQTVYLYMRGHDLFEKVIYPLLSAVCRVLSGERRNDIRRYAVHTTQRDNELSGYEHASADVGDMLRKQTDYKRASLYHQVQQDIRAMATHQGPPLPNAPVWTPDDWQEELDRRHSHPYPHHSSSPTP